MTISKLGAFGVLGDGGVHDMGEARHVWACAQCQRVATRYDNLAANCLALVGLAPI